MTDDGIHLHVTTKGKLLLVAKKGDESITFQLALDEARVLRNNVQSATSELANSVGTEA